MMKKPSKNIYCVIGLSGTGKSSLVNTLEDDYSLPTVQSYTTRPQREGESRGHIFIKPNEFGKLKKDMVAYTIYDTYKYGVTKDQVDKAVTYVIDLDGLNYFRQKYKSKEIKTILLTAPADVLKKRMQERGDDTAKIEARMASDAILRERFNDASRAYGITFDIILDTSATSTQECAKKVFQYIQKQEDI